MAHPHQGLFAPPTPYLRASYELLRDETEDSVELQAMLRNAHKQFEEIAKMSTALTDQVKIAALNTEHPGHFADLIAANLNLPLGRPPETAGNRFRPRALAETAAACSTASRRC